MIIDLLGHLQKAYASEEKIVQSLDHVLGLFLPKTDLPQDRVDKIKGILDELTQDSLKHEQTLNRIITELERHDD